MIDKLAHDLLISPDEAVSLAKNFVVSDIDIVQGIEKVHNKESFCRDDFAWTYYALLATLWNAGRIQGKREERRKRKSQKIKNLAEKDVQKVEVVA